MPTIADYEVKISANTDEIKQAEKEVDKLSDKEKKQIDNARQKNKYVKEEQSLRQKLTNLVENHTGALGRTLKNIRLNNEEYKRAKTLTKDAEGYSLNVFKHLADNAKEVAKGIGSVVKDVASGIGGAVKTAAEGIGKIGTGIAAAGAAAIAGATAGVKKVVDSASELAVLGDAIDKNSQKIGWSSRAYQEWDAVLQHSGTSMEEQTQNIKKFTKNLDNNNKDAAEGFKMLGLNMKEVSEEYMPEEAFQLVIEQLQGIEDETQRNVAASKIFGEQYASLGPLLNTSAEDTLAMRQQVEKLGGVLDRDSVKASAAFQDTLQDMQTTMGGLKNSMTSQFLKPITSVMNGVVSLFTGDKDRGIYRIKVGISAFISSLKSVAGDIMNLIQELIPPIIDAVMEMLPVLIPVVVDIIQQLLQTVMDNLGPILEGIIQICMMVGQQLISNLPIIITSVVSMISMLASSFADNIDPIIDGIIDTIINIADVMIDNLPVLITAIITIVGAIVKKFPDIVKQLASAVKDLVKELGQTLWDNRGMIIDKIKEVVLSAKDAIKNALSDIWAGIKGIFSKDGGGAESSNRTGLAYVPHDGYIAELHRGERVLTRAENERYNNGMAVAQSASPNITYNITVPNDGNALSVARKVRDVTRKELYGYK